MGLADLFSFKSKEQIKKEQQEFEKMVFPFGLPQREKALEVLRQVMVGKKLADQYRLFAFISAKEKYVSEEDPGDGMTALLKALRKQTWIQREDQAAIVAFVLLESSISSLENYPTAEQVRERAQRVLEEQLQTKKRK